MNKEELKAILDEHYKFLTSDGNEGRLADLTNADLRGVDLRRANLRNADLSGVDLRDANLRDANLSGADLNRADLRRADLRYANLSYANLSGADLNGAKIFIPKLCPEGSFIGWKKGLGDILIKLLIPEDAKRLSGTGRKCRASKAVVLDMEYLDEEYKKMKVKIASSIYDPSFIYEVGKTVEPTKPFDENRFNECSSGIHFFINREEAIRY